MEGADGERNEQGSPSSSEEEEDEKQFVSIDSKPKWDCESILSTYSNLYNHPTLIKDPPHTRNKVGSDNYIVFPRLHYKVCE